MPRATSQDATILLVEPHEQLRAKLAAGLRRDGLEVAEHASAETAIEALRQGLRPAVLVTDPQLGGMTGWRLAEAARVAAPRLAVIFTPAGPVKAQVKPAGSYLLPKPHDAEKLSRFIRLVAARSALRGTCRLSIAAWSARQAPAPKLQ
jgi:DNA-binding NtrC family response regulator